jgi:hypothetical protein
VGQIADSEWAASQFMGWAERARFTSSVRYQPRHGSATLGFCSTLVAASWFVGDSGRIS